MGFVASHVKDKNYPTSFHPSAFVIYRTDTSYNNIVVVLTMTSRHHILSNMQDRLLQLVQIIQYVVEKVDFHLIISNECVPTVTLNFDSRVSYESIGFDTPKIPLLLVRLENNKQLIIQSQSSNMVIDTLGQNMVIIFYLPISLDNVRQVTTEATVLHLHIY